MKSYELTYLISSALSEEELKNLSQKVIAFLQEEGGILKKIENPVKKRLGYPIKKELTHPFASQVSKMVGLVTLNFQLSPEKIESLEKKLKAENSILRYIILTQKTPKIIEARKIKELPSKPPIEAKKLKPKKVELKEIEKKLEEILGEA